MAIITMTIFASWLLSRILIKNYYYDKLKGQLKRTYNSCNQVFDDVPYDNSSSFMLDIDNEADAIIYVVDTVNAKVYSSVNENYIMSESLHSLAELLVDNDNNNPNFSQEEVENYSNYSIQITKDNRMKSSYFDLVGQLDNGFPIILRTSVSRVDSTINAAVSFFTAILIVAAFIGCLLMYFISNIFAKPIKRLTGIAARMSNLDFDARIVNPSNDEIGELAIYMNDLSDKLKYTLGQLQQANEKLQKDIDEKVQIDEMRKEFLSHVSHELKTPIALIQGYAEGLKDNVIEDEESKNFYCDVIVDESSKMNIMVKKLLALNEIEFGQNRLNKENFDIIDLIRNRINSSTILSEQNKANIEFKDSAPVYVNADEFMIEEVFTNYLTNAMHYCTAGGRVCIWTELTNPENIRIFVYNDGANIPDKELEKIFVRFYKVDKARTREYGGSGIGLSIVAASMEAHKKEYGVYNVENGVVFYFDLDVVVHEEEA
jgi:signal transduction histidine kinase